MTPLAVSLWIANVALETAGQVSLKAAASPSWRRMLRSPVLWTGVACFVLQFVAWLGLLSLIALSEAMLINSINIVAVMLTGRVMFGERLDLLRVTGASLVAVGVALAGASA